MRSRGSIACWLPLNPDDGPQLKQRPRGSFLESTRLAPAPVKPTPREAEVELSRRHHRGDSAAREQLVASHQHLVLKLARRFAHAHDLDDLVQEGNMGLMVAVEKFDPARGFRFGTYAMHWVNAYLLRFMKNQRIVHAKGAGPAVSLDAESGEDGEALVETLPGGERPVDEALEKKQLSADVRASLARLPLSGLQKAIVEERLMRETPSTLDELSVRWGLSRERVRQVELKTREWLARYMAPLQDRYA